MVLPVYDHIVIVMEENHGYSQIISPGSLSSNAPYINNTLVPAGALFSNSHGIGHPSFPNYLEFFSGSNQGITNDTCPPAGSPYNKSNLGQSIIAAGKTFGAYAQSYPGTPTACGPSPYAGRHVPSPWFSNLSTSTLHDFSTFPTTPTGFASLPTVSFVTPDLAHDMHSFGTLTDAQTVAAGDTWLKTNMDAYVQWAKTHNSLFILQFDEDNFTTADQVPTIFVGQFVVPGVYNENINHYNILATIETMYGATLSGGASTATVITDVFSSTPPPTVAPSIQLLQRVADGTEGSSFVVTASQSVVFDATITTITGENPVGYNDPTPANSGVINTSSTTIVVPGVTTTTSGDILVWYGFSSAPVQGAGTTSVPPPITLPTGFTRGAAQVNSTGVNTPNTGVVGGYRTQATAGPTGNENGSITAAQINGGLLVAVTASGNSNNMAGVVSDNVVEGNNQDVPADLSISPQGNAANVTVAAVAGTTSIIGGLALVGATALITVTAVPGLTFNPLFHESNVQEIYWETDITSSTQIGSQWAIQAFGTGTAMAMAWNTDVLVQAVNPILWETLDSVISQQPMTWETSSRVSSQKTVRFNIASRTLVTQKAIAFKVKARVTPSVAVAWNLNKRIKAAKRRILWGVGIRNSAIHQELFNTGALHVSPTKAMAWAVHEKVSAMLSSDWVLVSRPRARKRVTWHLKDAIVDQKASSFFCRKRVTSSLASSWNLNKRVKTAKKRILWNTLARVANR